MTGVMQLRGSGHDVQVTGVSQRAAWGLSAGGFSGSDTKIPVPAIERDLRPPHGPYGLVVTSLSRSISAQKYKQEFEHPSG